MNATSAPDATSTNAATNASSMNAATNASSMQNSQNNIDLWNRRLGHINQAYVKQLLKASDISISDSAPKAVCEPCIHGKQHVKVNRSPQQRIQKQLELVHSDSAGPFSCSLTGYIYFIIYIDDTTRMWWIHMFKSKSSDNICEVFYRFKAEVEQQSGFRIQRFWYDNGKGEYDNNQFRGMLSRSGTIMEP